MNLSEFILLSYILSILCASEVCIATLMPPQLILRAEVKAGYFSYSFCLFVSLLNYGKSVEQIFTKLNGNTHCVSGSNSFNFGVMHQSVFFIAKYVLNDKQLN